MTSFFLTSQLHLASVFDTNGVNPSLIPNLP